MRNQCNEGTLYLVRVKYCLVADTLAWVAVGRHSTIHKWDRFDSELGHCSFVADLGFDLSSMIHRLVDCIETYSVRMKKSMALANLILFAPKSF